MTNLEQLEMILWIHAGGTKTHCSCGEYLAPETTPYLQRKHIAQAIIDAGWTPPVEPVPFDADCWTCAKEIADKHRAKGDFATSLSFRMYLCPNCGNKRCPKAKWCRNKCSGSNEPGQMPYLDN